MTLTEFSIDRAKWGSGALLRDGRMCCLGFMSKACGVPDDMLEGRLFPGYKWPVPEAFKPSAPRPTDVPNTDRARGAAVDASNINDDKGIDWPDKEVQLIKLFKEHGITLSFYGEHQPPLTWLDY